MFFFLMDLFLRPRKTDNMKKQLLHLILSCFTISTLAQQLDNNYNKLFNRDYSSSELHVTTSKDGNLTLMQDTVLYFVDVANGDSLGKSVGLEKFITYPKGLVRSNDYYYLTGSLSKAGMTGQSSVLVKLNMQLDTLWRRELSNYAYGNEGSSILVNNSGIYVAGKAANNNLFIAHLSEAGDTSWVKNFNQTTFCNLTDIIETSDGNYLAVGHLDDYPLAYKFNTNGDTLWSYYEPTFISFTKAVAFERNQTEYVMVARNRFIVLDAATGNKKSETQGFIDYFDLEVRADTVYLFGTHKTKNYGGNQYPLVEVRNRNLDSLKSFQFNDNVHPLVNNRYSSGILLSGNDFACAGLVRDSVNLSGNQWNFLVSKFNANTVTTFAKTDSNSALKMFPNPTSGQLNFSQKIDAVRIFDLHGALIMQSILDSEYLNLSGLSQGTYMIETFQGGSVAQFKFILQ